ncbi:MAG: SGNH/GDSL hydrolase family protein, partial [Methyloceanibacter sp.]
MFETFGAAGRGLLAGFILIAATALPAGAESASGKHVVLLGDSAFANQAYTEGAPDVAAQLRKLLPAGWKVTLLAADTATNADIAAQLAQIPADASHLVLSVGGDNALGLEKLFKDDAETVEDALDQLAEVRDAFAQSYRTMLDGVLAKKLPVAVSTIYDARYSDSERNGIVNTALAIYNDVITREAFARGLPVVDLRLILNELADYANPIEP